MNTDEPLPAPDYEETDASPGMTALLAFSLVAIVAFCLIVAAGVYHHHGRGEGVTATLAPTGRFQHGAGERTGIEEAWQEQDRLVHEHLDTYGWIDPASGIVHLPLARAIDLLLAEETSPEPATIPTKAAP